MLRQLTLWEAIFIVALCVFAISTARAALVCGDEDHNEDGVLRSVDVMVPTDTDGAVYWYGQDNELIYIQTTFGDPRQRSANDVARENVIFWVGDDTPFSVNNL